MYAAAEKMKETNPKHAKWFKESLDSYREKALNDDAIYSYTKSRGGSWVEGVRPYYKDFAKKAALNVVSKVLGCNPGKLGLTYAAVTASYNLTYEVLNAVLPAGKAKNAILPYALYRYIRKRLEPDSEVIWNYARNPEKIPMLQMPTRARKITIWLLICSRATNKYLYECSYNFCANNHAKDELVYATTYKNEWVNVKCHNANAKSGKSKFVSIQCPTNVSVCDSAGKRIFVDSRWKNS